MRIHQIIVHNDALGKAHLEPARADTLAFYACVEAVRFEAFIRAKVFMEAKGQLIHVG